MLFRKNFWTARNILFGDCSSCFKSRRHSFVFARKLCQQFKRFGQYSLIDEPSQMLRNCIVPPDIIKPSYADSSKYPKPIASPEIKNETQISGMREACRIAKSILNEIKSTVKVGMTTEEIDAIVRARTFESKSYPSPFNYHGFPKSCCTSVNNVACHGIPDLRPLQSGDIVSVDITIYHKGFHGDCCETFLIGEVDAAGKHLVEITKICRDNAIEICGPGVPFADIGSKLVSMASKENLAVVSTFIGHGIGEYFHGPPDIYHCYNEYPGVMQPGMTFTIEPVLTQGSENVLILEDGWTAVTEDGARTAQFEHTLLITPDGHEILTQ